MPRPRLAFHRSFVLIDIPGSFVHFRSAGFKTATPFLRNRRW